jgi:trans-2,3-dihydro-3-hydroxyanthranilate isomerase
VIYVDAFTRQSFAGNPCAVLPGSAGLTDEQMQAVAREVNLPETAFVLPSSRAHVRVRYFTPHSEIPFAGHPTIATAFILAEQGLISTQEPVTSIDFEFEIGVLPVEVHIANGEPDRVVMTQQQPTFGETLMAEEVASCLGLQPSDLRSDTPPQVVGTGVPFLIVPVQDVEVLGDVRMDRRALAALCDRAGVSAAFVFSIGGFDSAADTHARLFDPRGTMEDPFTGSATGAMGAYVVHHGLETGPNLLAEQGHFVGRPGYGVLQIELDDGEIESVKLGGAAVRVMDGEFFIPEVTDEVNT